MLQIAHKWCLNSYISHLKMQINKIKNHLWVAVWKHSSQQMTWTKHMKKISVNLTKVICWKTLSCQIMKMIKRRKMMKIKIKIKMICLRSKESSPSWRKSVALNLIWKTQRLSAVPLMYYHLKLTRTRIRTKIRTSSELIVFTNGRKVVESTLWWKLIVHSNYLITMIKKRL